MPSQEIGFGEQRRFARLYLLLLGRSIRLLYLQKTSPQLSIFRGQVSAMEETAQRFWRGSDLAMANGLLQEKTTPTFLLNLLALYNAIASLYDIQS